MAMSEQQSQYLFNRCPTAVFPHYFCTHFQPLKQFFSAHPPVSLCPTNPQFTQTLSTNFRNNLSPSRQLQYLRRAVNHDYCDAETREILAQTSYQPFNKQGNVSLIIKESLYWANDTSIRQISIKDVLNAAAEGQWSKITMRKGKEVLDVHQTIRQLLPFGDNIIVRTPRIVFVVDPLSKLITAKYEFPAQIISLWSYENRQDITLFFSLFDGSQTWVQRICYGKRDSAMMPVLSDDPVHAGWALTRNESVLCRSHSVAVHDQRMKSGVSIVKMDSKKSRIFAGISLQKTANLSLFALADSLAIGIYDIRKSEASLLSFPHFSQEAPPSILQIASTTSLSLQQLQEQEIERLLTGQQEPDPVLTAHSPYPHGSAYFCQLDPQHLSTQQKASFQGQQSLSMLFDKGKMDRHSHPRSLTAVRTENSLCFFHLDNFDGISLQIFQRNVASSKSSRWISTLKRAGVAKTIPLESGEDSNCEWFQRRTLGKSLRSEESDHWTQCLGEEGDLSLEEKKTQQRYLRFADLKQFFREVCQQANKNQTAEHSRKENQEIQSLLQQRKQLTRTLPSIESTLGPSLSEEPPQLGNAEDSLTLEQLMQLQLDWEQE